MTCPRSRGESEAESSAAPRPARWPVYPTCGWVLPGAPGTRRPGEPMCSACPVELRIGIPGVQNGQCGALRPPLGRAGRRWAEGCVF